MTDVFSVRPATVGDVDVLTRHRAEMFRDMGALPALLYDAMCDASRLFFARALSDGEYLAWLASPVADPAQVVAGAGLQLRSALPGIRRHDSTVDVTTGLQGLVLNVYTERPWRRRGLAALLMKHVLEGARLHHVGSLVLHASPEGRPLYESLGFVPTNEMRYAGALLPPG